MVQCEVLEEGEKALFYKYDGNVSLKEGPKRIWLIRSNLKRLQRFTAKHDEFLKITFKSGEIEHRAGPCQEFLNLLNHISIKVQKCHCLNANEAIIVYKNTGQELSRRIEYGPTIFLVQPNEWLHNFSWHDSSDESKTKYVANKANFEILNFAPNQLYYNVDHVRTADDALIRIKVMIFYELKSIETMLNETKDPIADLINCCSSDITTFTSSKTYLNFIENCYRLNELDCYIKLTGRAREIGYEVTKVVFRGYFASPKLQKIHDQSMEMRTQLKLEHESQLQENEKLYSSLQNSINRLTNEQHIEMQKLINNQELERIKNENMLKLKISEVTSNAHIQKDNELKALQEKIDENKLKCEYINKLKSYGVDPTEYLLCNIPKADKIIQIKKNSDVNENASDFANIHFHE